MAAFLVGPERVACPEAAPDNVSATAENTISCGTDLGSLLERPSVLRAVLSAVFPAFDPEDRDYPLALRYDPPADYLDPLGLPHVPTRIREAGAQIVAIAIAKTPDWVSYSRNQNHYSRRGRRYDERPDLYRHSVIVRAVEWLADGGWIENNIAPANPRCGRQSVFRATAALLEALGKTPLPARSRSRRS